MFSNEAPSVLTFTIPHSFCDYLLASALAAGMPENFIYMWQEDTAVNDNLLKPWLQTEDGEEAERRLTQLITVELEPVIKGVIRFKLRLGGDSAAAQDADDLRQEALVEVLGRLRKLRSQPSLHAIGDVRGLVATITYRVCYRWLRRRSPHRNALRQRLQYVLTQQPGLALWPDAAKRQLGGLASWRGRTDRASAAQLQPLVDDESLRSWAGPLAEKMSAGKGLAEFGKLLKAIFTTVNLPIEFDELARLNGMLFQLKDKPSVSITTEEGSEISEAVAPDDVAWQVEKRIFLQRLWEEAQSLPLQQRAALLLNLRDADGRGCIALFPAIGVASMRAIAATLELPLEQFAALWNQLPLDDAAIAELLKLTRQQVINARKAARERLARRLRGFF